MSVPSVLAVVAHPDDEVLGAGGLLARTARLGGRAHALILTEGSSTQYPGDAGMIERKRGEALAAAEALAIEVEHLDLPDMALSTLPLATVTAPVEAAVSRLRPEWVVTHHLGDLNTDHRVVSEAARVACRLTPGSTLRRLLEFEVLSSTEWALHPFVPTVWVELDEQDVARKVDAMRAYSSELRAWPHPRSAEAILDLARLRGSQAGRVGAEAYAVVWERA